MSNTQTQMGDQFAAAFSTNGMRQDTGSVTRASLLANLAREGQASGIATLDENARMGNALLNTVYVTDTQFGGVGDSDGTSGNGTDNTEPFLAALDYVYNRGGGVVVVPVGIFRKTGATPVPYGVSVVGQGMTSIGYGVIYENNSAIFQDGPEWALDLGEGANQVISHLGLIGTSSALGGIIVGGVGTAHANSFATIRFIQASGFSKSGASVIYMQSSYRASISRIYAINNFTAFKFGGNVSTCKFSESDVSGTDVNGHAIDATESDITGVDVAFDTVYFESCPGQYPIRFNNYGSASFDRCGFEAMCRLDGTIITDPAIIYASYAQSDILIKNSRIDFFSGGDDFSGALTFLKLSDDHYSASIKDCRSVMNYGGGGRLGVTYKFVSLLGYGSSLRIVGNRLEGTGFSSIDESVQAYLGGCNTTYTPKDFTHSGNRISCVTGDVYSDAAYPYLDVTPASTGGSPNTTPITITGIATTTVWTRTFPIGLLGARRGIKITAWGRRTGTSGAKQAKLLITDTGGATTVNVTAASTAADNWRTEVTYLFRARIAQTLNVLGLDGTTPLNTSQELTKDNLLYPIQLDINIAVSAMGDTMTLDGLVVEDH